VRAASAAPRVLANRFELVAPLGAGATGEVYRAHDRLRGHDVALKLLPALDAAVLLRFKNEFRALHDIEHPNLVRLHELHEDRGTWFFTMELVEGVDVLTFAGHDMARARIVLAQIARALHHLHGEGLVHRDIKPTNVIVTPAGKAMVLDFGLVAPMWSPSEGLGTPAYMAPEQISGDIGPAADWYAFGVLVFRMVTGQLPFAVVEIKRERPAPRARDIRPDAPADLAALADALLEREPSARPRGSAVLATLGVEAVRATVTRSLVIGRDRELALLRDAVAAQIGRGAIALVGESGIGKTVLLRELAQELERGGAWVLNGRCWERESVPYKGFDGVMDDLATRLEEIDREVVDAGWNALLAQAFPVLRRVRGVSDDAAPADHEMATRMAMALRWLIAEVAARQPLVILIDDLQWADRDTLVLLRALLRSPVPNVVIGYAARERIAFDIGEQVADQVFTLQPLSQQDTEALVELVVRELGGELDAARIARAVGGHPLFARELARHAVATGETDPLSFEDVVRRLTERFGPEDRRIAAIISLANVPLSIEAAAHACGPTFFESIATLRGAQLVTTSGVGSAMRIEPHHDRIRQTLLEDLPAHERPQLHAAIARALEATRSSEHAALAYHWREAGEPTVAARHALRAAHQADAALAYHRAAYFYAIAHALDPSPPIRIRHAEALAQAGLGVEAAETFLACAREARGAEAIDLRRRAMQQLLLMGHSERALALLDELMQALELPNPRRPALMLLQLLRTRVAIRMHRFAVANTQHQPVTSERVALDTLWDAAAGLALVDPLRSFYLHSVGLQRCFRSKDGSRLARALLGEAPYLAASGQPTRRLERCLALADRVAEQAAIPALPPLARGSVAFLFGRWRECRDRLAACELRLQQDRPRLVREGFGLAHLQDLMRRLQLAAMFYLGELEPLRRRVIELLQDATDRDDVTSATHLRSGLMAAMSLAFGDVDAAVRNAREGFLPWRASRTGVPHFMDLQARTTIACYLGRGDEAYADVRAAWRGLERAQLMRAQYVAISLHDTRGRAALAAALREAGAARRDALADASRCAQRLEVGATWGVGLGASLRAGIALAWDDDDGARTQLQRAAATLEAADMPIHAANARMIHARLSGEPSTEHVLAGIVDIARYSRLLVPHA
jgi:eukaryotic-like serine/threonine-protein kinase